MNNIPTFTVDFSEVKNKQEVIDRLTKVLGLQFSNNWDSFDDQFGNLDSDSDVIRNMDPIPSHVHLVVKNIDEVKKVSENDFRILREILEHATDKEGRGDGIDFSYSIV